VKFKRKSEIFSEQNERLKIKQGRPESGKIQESKMNKFTIISAIAAICCLSAVSAQTSCARDSVFFTKDGLNALSDMKSSCVSRTREQIKTEIGASMDYLSMAVHFSKDSINRPGFAKLFFDAAGEEREHAYKLIEYLSMRGEYMTDDLAGTFDLTKFVVGTKDTEKELKGIDALKRALEMEKKVTKSIRELIEVCEKEEEMNHYHFVDYLTGEFLEEQYKGQRDIAGKLSTLSKMMGNQGEQISEFLFDKQLL
jgi:ferritin heavy chain